MFYLGEDGPQHRSPESLYLSGLENGIFRKFTCHMGDGTTYWPEYGF